MKRNNILIWISVLFLALVFSACYDDESTYDTNIIPEVVIDTTGIPARHSVFFNHTMTLEPKIYKKGDPDAELEYLWRIDVSSSDTTRMVLGHEPKLNAKITVSPNTLDYRLSLTVTDKSNGLQYYMYWKVFVSSEFGEGLIVADTKNGSTSDLNLIMANEFTEGFKNEGKDIIHRNLYSQSNGEEIDGVVCGVYYGNVYNKRRITAITPNSIVRLNPLDYQFMDRDGDAFFIPMEKIAPAYICNGYTSEYLVINKKVAILSAQHNTKYGYPYTGDYEVKKYIAVNPSTYYNSVGGGVVYDEKHNRFLWLPYFYNSSPMVECKAFAGGEFDPNNVGDKTCLFADLGNLNDYYFVMKDRQAENYYIYVVDGNTGGKDNGMLGKHIYNISHCPKIGQAVAYVFSPLENTLYYATDSEVYAVMLATENLMTELRYPTSAGNPLATGEKITSLEIHKGDGYATLGERTEEGKVVKDQVGSEYRLLLMTTYNETSKEGAVYTLPIKNLGAGVIAEDYVKRFGGFGRVLATYPQGK